MGFTGTGIHQVPPVLAAMRAELEQVLSRARCGPVRELKDMTSEEVARLERELGAKVKR